MGKYGALFILLNLIILSLAIIPLIIFQKTLHIHKTISYEFIGEVGANWSKRLFIKLTSNSPCSAHNNILFYIKGLILNDSKGPLLKQFK